MAPTGKRFNEEDLSNIDEKLFPEEEDLPIPLSLTILPLSAIDFYFFISVKLCSFIGTMSWSTKSIDYLCYYFLFGTCFSYFF